MGFVMIRATLAFGRVPALTYSLIGVVFFLALFLLFFMQTPEGKVDNFLPRLPLLFLLFAVLHLIPLPSPVVTRLAAHRMGPGPAGLSQSKEAWTTLSSYPHATLLALMKVGAYLCAFLLAAYVFDSRKRNSTLVRTLIYLGVFEA